MTRALGGRVGKLVAGLNVALFLMAGVCPLVEAKPAAGMTRDLQVDAILARGGGVGAIGLGGVLPPTGGESTGPMTGAVTDGGSGPSLDPLLDTGSGLAGASAAGLSPPVPAPVDPHAVFHAQLDQEEAAFHAAQEQDHPVFHAGLDQQDAAFHQDHTAALSEFLNGQAEDHDAFHATPEAADPAAHDALHAAQAEELASFTQFQTQEHADFDAGLAAEHDAFHAGQDEDHAAHHAELDADHAAFHAEHGIP